ncbi:hypothetical protein [Sphingomonas immobilis]|uniref:Uncharacterized protein n=1 Tax=Sphingomonas immobilis TaxID=3063997 RepID=A0ABT9A492_9SPHN|nr:hypothetical protein [Sphingomonas sp. CA1-15]MDO7844665.1 hypothetical protein [Sphingomonas sp. CA1-15]
MLNILSILVGVVVFLLALIGFIPLLGWLNWLIIPLALFGIVLGALSSHKSGRNLNIVLIVFCAVRLFLGGGLI